MRNQDPEECVTTEEGNELMFKIGAFSYIECSAKTQSDIKTVFEEAVRASQAFKKEGELAEMSSAKGSSKKSKKSKKCQIL